MRATTELEHQHQTIGRVAKACEVFAEMLDNGTLLPASALQSVVAFLQVYDHDYHREQEEWLLNLLRARGVPSGGCPISALENETHRLNILVTHLARAVELYSNNPAGVTHTLREYLHIIAEAYAEHIWKEDFLLLPMADKLLTDGDQQLLASRIQNAAASKGIEAHRVLEDLTQAMKGCPQCGTEPQLHLA